MIQASKGHQMNACIHLYDFGTRKSHGREQEHSDKAPFDAYIILFTHYNIVIEKLLKRNEKMNKK